VTRFFRGPVVCGVDLSDASCRALTRASALADTLRRPLTVVSVIDPLIAEAAGTRMGSASFLARVRQDLDVFIRTTLGPRRGGRKVSVRTPTGPVAKELVAAAGAVRAGLIVIGTEGLGRARRFLFGSTTLGVLRRTRWPVLAVPPPGDSAPPGADRIERILCGIDFSEPSRAAARAGVVFGRVLGAPVTLVHAVGRVTLPSMWDVMVSPTDAERGSQARRTLLALAARLGTPVPAVLVGLGEADEVLGREAASGGEPLIVLGLGGLAGHRPGATAMRIMAETRVPVLIVPKQ